MHVSGLYIYPVKSMRGLSVSSVGLDNLGFAGDRRFMVVDDTGRFLTQRTLPKLALIETSLTPETLSLALPRGKLHVQRASDTTAALLNVSVWKSANLKAEDCGDTVANELSEFLGARCRLVRAGSAFHRPITKPAAEAGDRLSFADGYPLLVIGEASLDALNDRLVMRNEEPIPMNRFRPNLVIQGAEAFAEDSWGRVRIGDVILRAGNPCARCVVTTTDQLTGDRGKEPLRTLSTFRRDKTDPSDVNFGHNYIHETKSGLITIGATVEVLAAQSAE